MIKSIKAKYRKFIDEVVIEGEELSIYLKRGYEFSAGNAYSTHFHINDYPTWRKLISEVNKCIGEELQQRSSEKEHWID